MKTLPHFKLFLLPILLAFLATGLGMLIYSAADVEAESNSTINFQGKIVNKVDGTNLSTGSPGCIAAGADTCDFRVSIYTDSTAGTLLWQEVHSNIELGDNDGIFNLSLNSVCNNWTSCGGGSGISWGSDSTIYIQVELDDDGNGDFSSAEVFTRKLLTSVPYAYYADSAGSVNGITSDRFIQFYPDSAQNSGNTTNKLIWLNEDGTTTPNLLEIEVGGVDKFVITNQAGIMTIAGNLWVDG